MLPWDQDQNRRALITAPTNNRRKFSASADLTNGRLRFPAGSFIREVSKLQSYRVTELQRCRVAKFRSCWVDELRRCWLTRHLRNFTTLSLPPKITQRANCRTERKRFFTSKLRNFETLHPALLSNGGIATPSFASLQRCNSVSLTPRIATKQESPANAGPLY